MMKAKLIFITVLQIFMLYLTASYAQDNTKTGLPEGAFARLGKGGINTMRFSSDGTHLAVGTDVGLWLYDARTGQETAMFTGHKGQVNAIAFSPDGQTIASGGFSNPIIQLWDVNTAKKLSNIYLTKENIGTKSDYASISFLYFAEDGKTLITKNTHGTLHYLDIETGTSLEKFGNLGSFKAIAYSKEDNGFATGNREGGIVLYDATGKRRVRLRGHAGLLNKEDKEIWALAFSPDGNILASGSEDKTVRLWNTENGKNLTILKNHKSRILSVTFSHDGEILASGDADGIIRLWSVETNDELAALIGHTNGISALTASPDGRTIASGSYDGTIRFWDQNTGFEISTFATGHAESVSTMEFTNDSTILTSVTLNGTIDVWNVRDGSGLSSYTLGENISVDFVAISNDAKLLATHASEAIPIKTEGIRVRDITADQMISGPWENFEKPVNGLVFSNDKKILAVSVGWEGIIAWNIDTGAEEFNIQEREPFERELVYSPNGSLFAAYGTHATTHIWHAKTQEEVTHQDMEKTTAFAFSPDNTRIATGSRKGIVLWTIEQNEIKKLGTIGNSRLGDELIFSPDNKILLIARIVGWDYEIQLIDTNTGWNLGRLTGHTERINSLKFSHDGKTLATGSSDGTILLWDWEQIVTKARNEIKGKDLSHNIIPPKPPIEYANKTEEAKAILSWMQTNGIELNKKGKGYQLKQGNSSSTISGGGGTLGLGDVRIDLDRGGTVKVRVDGVGSATFIFDENGKIKHLDQNDENTEDK